MIRRSILRILAEAREEFFQILRHTAEHPRLLDLLFELFSHKGAIVFRVDGQESGGNAISAYQDFSFSAFTQQRD
jgi:hypothetical protein